MHGAEQALCARIQPVDPLTNPLATRQWRERRRGRWQRRGRDEPESVAENNAHVRDEYLLERDDERHEDKHPDEHE